jgi:hypothetical protein
VLAPHSREHFNMFYKTIVLIAFKLVYCSKQKEIGDL